MKKLTTSEFIEKARKIHGDKYDYSKVDYVNAYAKVCIICPEHGEFFIQPNNFLSGQGCKKCGVKLRASKRKKFNNETFKIEAKKIHGDKYSYDESEYVSCDTKLKIICHEHGEFWQTPYHHIHDKNGCPKCAKNLKYSTECWINEAKKVHGDKYDYSKTKYVDAYTKVCIICSKHGEFWQTPVNHLNGSGCPKCKGKNKTTEDFINESKIIHDDYYKYDKTSYNGAYEKTIITCPVHGDFEQTPHSHLMGEGCPLCSSSKLEKNVSKRLKKENILYVHRKTFDWLGKQHLDFYLPEYNVAIECQGIQHFIGTNFGSNKLTNEESLELVKKRDIKKNNLCKENDINLLYLTNRSNVEKNNIIDMYNENNLYYSINDLLIEIRKRYYGML